jgi:predicted phosphoribosyltransferase
MYFASRVQAGRMLASQLMPKYRYENCAVVALNNGGVVIGAQIAMQLHCPLTMLLSKEINLPREPDSVASIAQDGSFSYNNDYSSYELGELQSEYFQFIEQEKMNKLQEMHRLVGDGGTIRKDLLRGRYIILVSDGIKSGHSLDVSVQYLKPVASEGVVIATPLASVPAVDYMHVLADDLYVLSVVDNYLDTDHYYETQDVPEPEKVVDIIEKIVLNWQ